MYFQNWWGLKNWINKLMRVPEVILNFDQSSYFYVPSDERNLEGNQIAYYSAYLPIFTIQSFSRLVIHGIDVFIVRESLCEAGDCDRVMLQCSEHTTDWLTDFRTDHPVFQGTLIEEGSSKRMLIPKCAVTTTPMRGCQESPGELPFVYLIVIVHIHTSYLWLLCRVHEMSPRIHCSTILTYQVRDNKDDQQPNNGQRRGKIEIPGTQSKEYNASVSVSEAAKPSDHSALKQYLTERVCCFIA